MDETHEKYKNIDPLIGQKYTTDGAVALIREIEPKLAAMGIHTALTGSTLYKGISTKDFDILLYPHNPRQGLNISDVRRILKHLGFIPVHVYGGSGSKKSRLRASGAGTGRVVDIMDYHGQRIDMFLDSFPEPTAYVKKQEPTYTMESDLDEDIPF